MSAQSSPVARPHVVMVGLGALSIDDNDRLHVAATDVTGDPLADLADVVQPLLVHAPVVVIHPRWDPAVGRTVNSLHTAIDDTRFLRHSTPLPPLAAAALGEVAVRLAPYAGDPGVLVAGLESLGEAMTAGALLASVSQLEHLSASLFQHMASWLPSSRFLAVTDSETGIERLRRDQPVPLPSVGADRRVLLAIGDTELEADMRAALDAQDLGMDDGADVVDLSELSARWWGTRDAIEFAIVPRQLMAAELLDAMVDPADPCSWCGGLSPVTVCHWCGHERAQTAVPA